LKILTLATLTALLSACNFDKNKTVDSNVINLGEHYFKCGNQIYFESDPINPEKSFLEVGKDIMEVKNVANPKTFQIVDCFIGKDSLHVYSLSGDSMEIIVGADPKTFREITDIPDTTTDGLENAGISFYRDSKNLYKYEKKVEGVDPNTVDLRGWSS
jgi:hypothetical protein